MEGGVEPYQTYIPLMGRVGVEVGVGGLGFCWGLGVKVRRDRSGRVRSGGGFCEIYFNSMDRENILVYLSSRTRSGKENVKLQTHLRNEKTLV